MNRELLIEALNDIKRIDAKQFDLSDIVIPGDWNKDSAEEARDQVAHDCNTIACAMGWLGLMPKWQERGLITQLSNEVEWNGTNTFYAEAAAELFDIPENHASLLFRPADSAEKGRDRLTTDKDVFMRRMDKYLTGPID